MLLGLKYDFYSIKTMVIKEFEENIPNSEFLSNYIIGKYFEGIIIKKNIYANVNYFIKSELVGNYTQKLNKND